MNRKTLVAVAAIVVSLGGSARAVTVFNDTFGTSTLNAPTGSPTATSANYSVLSSKNSLASSIAPGSLQLHSVQTSAGITEIQARFASTPLTLTAVDDYVELSMTFITTKVHNLNGGGNFAAGLYNSGGVDPVPGDAMGVGPLANSGLSDAASTFATGYAQNWVGYHSRNPGAAASANWQFFYRPPQTDVGSDNQELLQTNVGGGAYDMPGGTEVAPRIASTLSLANGSTYTYTFRVEMAEGGLLDLSDNIYEGSTATGTPLFTHTVQTIATTPLVTQFDGLAIGMRPSHVTGVDPNPSDPAGPHIMNFSRIAIDTNLAAPPMDNANFNGDEQVDGDDLLIWQRNLGSAGGLANGDANNSGTVDANDLGIWRNHFGQPTGVAAASPVPEPTCGALAAFAGALVAAVRRRRG